MLSQDGVLAKALIGPASTLDKEYVVKVTGPVDAGRIARLRHGLSLDGRALKPAEVEQTAGQTLRFVLREGRNRQIRRMCELVGLEVETALRKAGKGYVLGVTGKRHFRSWGKAPVVGTADEIAATLEASDWKRLSAGEGTKGARLHNWASWTCCAWTRASARYASASCRSADGGRCRPPSATP